MFTSSWRSLNQRYTSLETQSETAGDNLRKCRLALEERINQLEEVK